MSPLPHRAGRRHGWLFVIASCSGPPYPASAPHTLIGHPMNAFQHERSLDGRAIDAATLAGSPVLVKFFADYCEPCQATLPAAQRLHESFPDILFVGVSEDDSRETARVVVAEFGLTFPVVHDADNSLLGAFRVDSLPMTFLVDAGGTIRWAGAAGQTEDDLRNALEAVR